MCVQHVAYCSCEHIHKRLNGCDTGGWRNGLLFDPLQQYGNYSYADVMLYPLAAALSQAADADTKIYMAMQVCERRSESFLINGHMLVACAW